MHRKEYQIMHAVRKAREQRRLNKLTEKKFKKGEQLTINFFYPKLAHIKNIS
jgi:hypothetical protein